MLYRFMALCALWTIVPPQNELNDFKHVMSSLTVEQADSAVVTAIRAAGLKISKNTRFQIEGNETGKTHILGTKVERVLSATISVGDSTGVFIIGEELRFDRTGWMTDKRRVNERDHAENGKFWEKVVTVAKSVDSAGHAAGR